MTELFPVQNKFPILFPLNTVTGVAANLTEALQNPAPASPIPEQGEKNSSTEATSEHIQHVHATSTIPPPPPFATSEGGNT